MYYFDNKFLQQYIDAGAKLQVYYNSEWYSITDLADLHNADEAVGYDEYGEPKSTIPYKQIELIMVNGSVYTRDQLQSMRTGEESADTSDNSDTGSKKTPDDEPEPEDEPEAEEKPSKKPDLSWYSPHYNLGRKILKEYAEKHASRTKKD